MAHHRVGDVLGHRVQRRLGDRVRAQHGLAAVTGHARHVDDRAGHALALHHLDRRLRQEEGRAHVDVHQPLVELRRRVPDRAALGEGAGVDQDVQRAEGAVGGCHKVPAIVQAGEVARHEPGVAAQGGDLARDRLTPLGVAAGHHHARRAALRERPRGGRAEPLRAAGDQRVLPRKGSLPRKGADLCRGRHQALPRSGSRSQALRRELA